MNKLFRRSLIASAIAATIGSSVSFAGDVTGKVTEAGSGRPLPNATV
jgi:hypothetical protein